MLRGRGMIESNQLTWRTIENGFALHRWQTKTPLLHVVPDTVYPGMWRVRSPDGRLTDMANLTRVRAENLDPDVLVMQPANQGV